MDTSPTSSAPRIAVVTVSFGSEAVLARFLPTIDPASVEQALVVVADNKPTPDSAVRALAHEHNAIYLPLPENRGYGGAINAAAAMLPPSVEWILVSNPDVELQAGSLDLLVKSVESDETIGSAGPAILNEDSTLYPSARRIPSIRYGIGHALFANIWPDNRWSRGYHNAPAANETTPRDAGWLSGACVLVRRSAFESLRGFDEGYFMYFEDVDLGFRLHKAGLRNVYVPAAKVLHTGAHSTTGESDAMIDAHHRSAMRFLGKKYPGPLLWPLRVVMRTGLSIRSAAERRRSRRLV